MGFLSLHEAVRLCPPFAHCGIVAAANGEGKLAHQALLELRVVSESANWIAQMPLSVAAISMRPSGERAMV
jgi:hypothetical protein